MPQRLPAVGAESLKDGVVRADAPADLLGRLGVELGIEGERHVDDAAARGADDMCVRLDGAIEAAAPGVLIERISPASAKRLRLR